jgi:hypothetical protein
MSTSRDIPSRPERRVQVTAIVIGNAVLAVSVLAAVVGLISWAIAADRRAIEGRSVHQPETSRLETAQSPLTGLEAAATRAA